MAGWKSERGRSARVIVRGRGTGGGEGADSMMTGESSASATSTPRTPLSPTASGFSTPAHPHPRGASYGFPLAPPDEDEVVVETTGSVTFRMWDIHRGEPEARCREACKRAFGLGWCSKRSPEVAIDWDFLLED